MQVDLRSSLIKGLFKLFATTEKNRIIIWLKSTLPSERIDLNITKREKIQTKAKLVCVTVNASSCISDILSIVRLHTGIECISEIKENVDFERHQNWLSLIGCLRGTVQFSSPSRVRLTNIAYRKSTWWKETLTNHKIGIYRTASRQAMSQVYQKDKTQEKKIKHYLCVPANYDIFLSLNRLVLTCMFIKQIFFEVLVLVQHKTVGAAS